MCVCVRACARVCVCVCVCKVLLEGWKFCGSFSYCCRVCGRISLAGGKCGGRQWYIGQSSMVAIHKKKSRVKGG